jgi:hypothetical protein
MSRQLLNHGIQLRRRVHGVYLTVTVTLRTFTSSLPQYANGAAWGNVNAHIAIQSIELQQEFAPTTFHRGKVMAKRGRPKKVTTASAQVENGETSSGYFRRVFTENPKLLVTRSNDELVVRWLADHPGQKAMPPKVQKHLSNVKSILRKKGRKKLGRPKTVAQAAVVQAVSAPPTPTRIAHRGLEALEEMIDDCLTVARNMDRDGLDDVIRLLRNARNATVWKLGQ